MTGIILESSNTLLRVVNDLLDFSKIGAGKMALIEEPFDIWKLVTGIIRRYQKKDKIEVSASISGAVPKMIIGDGTRISQIVSNLVDNAVKFTEQGKVSVIISHEDVVEDAGSDNANPDPSLTIRKDIRVIIQITDTGIGMSEDALKLLFQPYTQVDVSTKKRYKGTGLGLSISKNLARLMGGDIECESSSAGSAFTVTLSLQRYTGLLPEGLTVPMSEMKTLHPDIKILIVEDNEINRKVVGKLLQKLGFMDIQYAVDGREAVEKAITNDFNIILMDVQMPVMDGFAASRALRDGKVTSAIIATTGYAFAEDRSRCLPRGWMITLANLWL